MQRKLLAIILAAVMGMSLTACGNKENGSDNTGEQSSASESMVSEEDTKANSEEKTDADAVTSNETIRIGFLTPMSGANATYGLQVKAAGQMVCDVINEAHPEMAMALAKDAGLPNLNGAKIELVFADSK